MARKSCPSRKKITNLDEERKPKEGKFHCVIVGKEVSFSDRKCHNEECGMRV